MFFVQPLKKKKAQKFGRIEKQPWHKITETEELQNAEAWHSQIRRQKVLVQVSSHSPERWCQPIARDGVCNMSAWNSPETRGGKKKNPVLGFLLASSSLLCYIPHLALGQHPVLIKSFFFLSRLCPRKGCVFRKGILSYLTGSVSCSPLTRSSLSFMRTCCRFDVYLYCVSITEQR